MATDESLRRRLQLLTQRAPHYPLEAYLFVQQAVALTQRRAAHATGARHVTGQELLEGIRLLAIEEFGPFARIVFNEWGITTTRDFGQIVFHMVEQRLLGARKSDSLADFEQGYDFAATFEHPFLPTGQPPTLPCLDRP